MRTRTLVALAALLAVVCTAAPAAEYKLGPGDTIEIKIINFDDLSNTVKVQPDGGVTLPLLGEVKVSGKTADSLAKELTQKYAAFVVKPAVSVTIRDFRQDTCVILGPVGKTGVMPITDGMTVWGVIGVAGGPLDKADLARVTLTRLTGETIKVNALDAMRDPSKDVEVHAGDIIVVPESVEKVIVLGSVAKPGNYDFKEGLKVLDILTMAGGLLDDADSAASTLTRSDGKAVPVNLENLLAKGEVESNLLLRPGDVLYVPKLERRYYIFGEVARAGFFPAKENDHLVEALAKAGGTMPAANLGDIGIVRMVEGKPQIIHANMSKFIKSADQSQNVALQDADVVYVAPRKSGFEWAKIAAPLSIWSVVLGLRR